MTVTQAEDELNLAATLNPGKWIEHSRNVARAAVAIAAVCGLDTDRAYKAGLLHDIGRRVGICHLRHVWEGYLHLKDSDPEAARVCLSHSFPNQILGEFQGARDLPPVTESELAALLGDLVYDEYDRLIQLCDSLGTAEGLVRPEVRWVDVALRLGVNEFTVAKWRTCLDIRRDLEARHGFDLAALLLLK